MTEIPDGLKPGDPVHVEFDAAYQCQGDNFYQEGYVELRTENPPSTTILNKNRLKITRRDPENWPPQAGDVWEADGEVWFVRNHSGGWQIVPAVYNGTAYYGKSEGIARFKALNPVLKYRPGV
jgi:hypothetical protein